MSSKIFNKDLVGVNVKRPTIQLHRPSYVGMCILDLSNTLMYDFQYNYVKKKYNNKAKQLFIKTNIYLITAIIHLKVNFLTKLMGTLSVNSKTKQVVKS